MGSSKALANFAFTLFVPMPGIGFKMGDALRANN